jgi:hypothetical protein
MSRNVYWCHDNIIIIIIIIIVIIIIIIIHLHNVFHYLLSLLTYRNLRLLPNETSKSFSVLTEYPNPSWDIR